MIDYRNEIAPKMLGLWPEFFANIGIDVGVMRGQNSKNGPCPLCGGEDRAHWRDVDGRLALYCRHCSDGGMHSPEQVYMEATGRSFAQFVEDASNFVSFVPNEVIAAKVVQRKTLREPKYCASMPESECRKVLDANPDAMPVFKRIDGKLVMCNVAMADGSFASGKYSSLGFCIIGEGAETVVTPRLEFAKWYAIKFDCRVIWALNPPNLRELIRTAKAPMRIVMEWNFDDVATLENGNPDQLIELVDMATGLRGMVDSVERLLDNNLCPDIAGGKGVDMIGKVKCWNEQCGAFFIGTARAKYCSERCKKAYQRAKKKAEGNGEEVERGGLGAKG